jgi:transposase
MWYVHCHHHKSNFLTISAGARLIYLPPYSPDFNPIEEAFSFIKAWIRRHSSEIEGKEGLPWLIYRATQAVTPEVCHGWFIDCGYM